MFLKTDVSKEVRAGLRASGSKRGALPSLGAVSVPGIAKAAGLRYGSVNGLSRQLGLITGTPGTRSGRSVKLSSALPPPRDWNQPALPARALAGYPLDRMNRPDRFHPPSHRPLTGSW